MIDDNTQLLLRFPSSAAVLAFLARFLTLWIPSGLLKAVLRAFMGFPTDAAVTTAAFIKNRWGVAQAPYSLACCCRMKFF